MPGPVTLTESFGSVRSKAPSAAASSFFGGYALEGRQRERLTQRRGIGNPTDLYAMLREFGSSIAGAVTISDPQSARRSQPRYDPVGDGEIIARLRRAATDGDLGSDDQSRSMLAGAGFGEIQVADLTGPVWVGRDAEDAISYYRSTPEAGRLVESVDERTAGEITEALRGAPRPRGTCDEHGWAQRRHHRLHRSGVW